MRPAPLPTMTAITTPWPQHPGWGLENHNGGIVPPWLQHPAQTARMVATVWVPEQPTPHDGRMHTMQRW